MNHVMRRRQPKVMSKARSIFILLSARALPTSGPGGIRRKAWRELIVGTCGERENLSFRCQGRSTSGYNRNLLTPAEVAEKLRITQEQIRNLIRKGRLPAVNIGTGMKRPLYRITQQALNEFLYQRQQPRLTKQGKKFKQDPPVPDFFPHLK